MTLNIRYGNGVLIVVLVEVTTLTEYICIPDEGEQLLHSKIEI